MFGRRAEEGLLNDLNRARLAVISHSTNATSYAVGHARRFEKRARQEAGVLDKRAVTEIRALSQRLGYRVDEGYVRGVFHTALAVGGLAASVLLIARGSHRIRTAADIPRRMIGTGRSFTGWVSRVGDGDGLRVRHSPLLRMPFRARRAASKAKASETVSIRLAGVDAPECAHFGMPGQAYGNDAKKWLDRYTRGRRVRVVVHAVDQYNRALASVFRTRGILPFRAKNVSVELAKAGYATVYEGSNAQFGKARRQIERAVAQAQKRRRGMWGAKGKLESPAEFKRRLKTGSRAPPATDLKKNTAASASALTSANSASAEDVTIKDFIKIGGWLYRNLKKFR